jgi:hypothetical protein
MNLVLLFVYHISLYLVGTKLLQRFKVELPVLFFMIGSFLIGMLAGIPVTYGLACLLVKTGEPIFWSVVVITIASFGLIRYVFVKQKPGQSIKISLNEILLITFSLIFGTWLMFKTFHGGENGQLFVGSNNVFDFGHALGLIRSMSWGSNIPIKSPFYAGLPFFYHFFFLFWTSIWEYLGIPVVWAMNAPSILSFSALLVVVYYFTQLVFRQDRLTGWIAVLFTITHSTLAFWLLLMKNGLSIQFIRDLLRIPTYPFAGPFDGSQISLYMTLNNYVNQRHLAFSVAVGLFLIVLYNQKKQSEIFIALLGLFTGLLFLWNMPVCLLVGGILTVFVLLTKRWREVVVFTVAFAVGIVLLSFPYIPEIPQIFKFFTTQMWTGVTEPRKLLSLWTPFSYLWQNLGILPGAVIAGFFVMKKSKRTITTVFIVLFTILCLFSVVRNRGFDQKFLSFLIIPINAIAAAAVMWLWKQKNVIVKFMSVVIVFILTISGFVDLLVVKNEFAFPLISSEITPVISWIHSSTPKDAIFISYRDILDPVVFSGRTNYFGFFGNAGQDERSSTVKSVYQGDSDSVKEHNISYILIPKWQKNDFPYMVNEKLLRSKYKTVYVDQKYEILETKIK